MSPPVQSSAEPKLLPHEIFSEAISVVPWVHLPRGGTKKVITFGYDAAPAGEYALRHRETIEAVFVEAQAPKDARARTATSEKDFILGWKADLACIAKPGLNLALYKAVQMLVPTGLVCIALERFDMIVQARAMIRPLFREMMIYRENLPEPSLFILASNNRIERIRPVSSTSRRYTDRYVASLFTFAKDELQVILGQVPGPPVPMTATGLAPTAPNPGLSPQSGQTGPGQAGPGQAGPGQAGPGLPGVVDLQGPANALDPRASFWPGRR